MNLFISIFGAVALMFFLGAVGFWMIHKRIVEGEALRLLVPLAVDISLPCMIFVNIVTGFSPEGDRRWWVMLLLWAAFTLAAFLISLFFSMLSARDSRREFFASLFYHNGIFFPLMILVGMYGQGSVYVVSLFVFTLLYPGLFHGTIPLVYHSESRESHLFNHIFIATVFGLLLRLYGLHTYIPAFVVSGLRMVGGMAIPVILMIIGGNIYLDFKRRGEIRFLELSKFVVIKNILYPAIALSVLMVLHLRENEAMIILLSAASPPLTIVPVMTERYGGNASLTNQFLAASFLFSIISVPVVIYIYKSTL